jgi:putative transposase
MSGQHDVTQLCAVLAVSRSGYYDWLKRQAHPAQRVVENTRLCAQIREVFVANEEAYGSPRVTRALHKDGVKCGRHRIARLMRQTGLRGRPVRRFRVRTTDSNHAHPIAPNRLLDQPAVKAPNQVWVADLTYVETAAGWLYLAGVMDLFSRKIVGWATARTLETTVVLQALKMAIVTRRPPPGLIVHSDRGVQYASAAHRALLAAHQLTASMSRRANCYDNAAMEAFWSSLKMEKLHRYRFTAIADAHRAIFHYIEAFYNSRRLHSSLGYRTPLDFESLSN